MIKNIVSLGVFLVLLTSSCAQDTVVDFDSSKLLRRLEILSSDKFEGRQTGEKGNDLARAFIIDEFKSINVKGLNSKYEHSFSFERNGKSIEAKNIVVEIKGTEFPDKNIVISAHHDHLGIKDGKIYNGADDDASGIAALLSFAEYLSKNPPKHSVILVAFDAEEIGLRGAKHFVETFDNSKIVANLNMDMISRSSKNELYVVGARYNNRLKAIIKSFKNPTASKLLEGHDGTDGKDDWTMASDHGPFHNAGIPFLYFGNEDHAAYHKPEDDFKDITPEFYINSVQIILSVFKSIDNSGL